MNKRTLIAEACERIDVFVSQSEDITRSAAKKLIDEGKVTVNGKVSKASKSLVGGEVVEIEITEPEMLDLTPENIPLDIVYQDEDIAVINKQQGLTVHAGNGNLSGTLVNALLYHLDSLSGINGVIRPGIVHRIDKDTSGLLVVAKNDKAHLSLSKQIAEKTCKREYLAVCEGIFKDDEGTVSTYIGRHPTERIKMAVVSQDKGKYAVTHYKVIARFDKGFTLVKFILETGRTHQIRVHAKYLGHAVVGDPVYGSKKQKFNLNGQLLHAAKLTLKHPSTGEIKFFEAPLPDYFLNVLQTLKKGGYTEVK